MAKAGFTGPLISLGPIAGNMRLPAPGSGFGVGQGPVEYSDEIGPSIFWSGLVIPVRGSKDKTGPGSIAGVFGAFPIRTMNGAPGAGAGALTTAANAVSGAALPNVTAYNAARSPVPVALGGVSTTGLALDKGLDAATLSTAGTATLTGGSAGNAWRYRVGQWVCLLNGGGGGAALMTQIQSIAGAVLNVSPAPALSGAGQVALTNLFNPNAYGAMPTGVSALAATGTARILIPEVGVARGVGVLGVAGSPAGVPFLIQGLDLFGGPQSELIVHPGGAVTAWGKKTYSVYILAVAQASAAFNYTVVTSDLIGLAMSVLSADSLVSVTMAGVAQTTANYTVVPADLTNPSTTTTGDTRGGIQVTANGPAAAPATPMTLNGANVLTVQQMLNPLQVALASAAYPGPLLGVLPI